jgi:hypothetical protein
VLRAVEGWCVADGAPPPASLVPLPRWGRNMIQSLLIGNINDFVVSPPSVLRTATSPRRAGGGFRVRRLVLQILPELVSGRGTAAAGGGGGAFDV